MESNYRTLFLNMPFGGIDRPALGVSSLKSNLEAQGFLCDIAYFNLQFANLIGIEMYEIISNSGHMHEETVPYTMLVGEWLFSQFLYGEGSLQAEQYLDEILRARLSENLIARILALRPLIPQFLQDCLEQIDWDSYQFIGFTTTFEQNMASIALAKMVKEQFPHLFVAFGGGNCEGEMGVTLAEQYSFIDAVCTGEGDLALPVLLVELENGRSPAGVQGFAWRDVMGNLINNGNPDVVQALDDLPIPVFDDYFAQLDALTLRETVNPILVLEASRGCWWGAKNHCTFCGLNALTMTYRRKNSERVLEEISTLVDRYQLKKVAFVDNILDYGALKSYVVTLSEQDHDLEIFCETKSNLRKDQIALLADAGIYEVQPGIESFDSNTLKLMKKGVTGMQNVAFLKWAQQFGVDAYWNILYGFPAETPEAYAHQLDVMRRITHFNLPSTVAKIRLDRFSPHFTQSEAFGFTEIRPLSSYQYVYPFTEEVLSRLCYFFEYAYKDGRNPVEYTRELTSFWFRWKKVDEPGTLYYKIFEDGSAQIRDTRFNRCVERVSLDKYQFGIYKICDKPRCIRQLMIELCKKFPEREFEEEKVIAFLEFMWFNYLMVREGDTYLAVALPEPKPYFSSSSTSYRIQLDTTGGISNG